MAVPGEPDPQRAEWLLRRTKHARAAILRQVPVLGLGAPALSGWLAEWQTGSEGMMIELSYGTTASASGPYVEVRTYLAGQLRPALAELLADERDRLFDHAEIDEPEPEHIAQTDGRLAVDGVQAAVEIRTEDHLWAGHVVLPPQLGLGDGDQPAAVSVLARGVAFGDVTLSLVHDLRPFAAAADDWFRELVAREAARPRPTPAAPSGVDGHQRLLEYLLAGLPNPRVRHPRAPAGQRAAAWESAVLGQMRLAGQSRHEADHAVTLMVNQVLRLADTAPWWAHDGVAATAECIR